MTIYKRVIFTVLIILSFSCGKKKLSNHPFIVTKGITCNDLYENGYKLFPGECATWIGKRNNDTLIYYHVIKGFNYDINILSEDNKAVKIDSIKEEKIHEYEEYLDQDPLILSDSIYSLIWGDIKEQQKSICKNGLVTFRVFKLKIKQSEIINFKKRINTNNYEVLDKPNNSYTYKVVNLVEKDTFDCRIYKDKEDYVFSSSIRLKNK